MREKRDMAKVMVIDGDAETRRSLCLLLSGKGFQAAAVPQGVDAARVMRHDVPDLVLIDQEIPLGGMKTAQIIRLNRRYCGTPILLGLKPGAPEQTREVLKEVIKHGISWALARPYHPDRLLAKMEECLGKAAKKETRTLTPEEAGMAVRKQVRELTDLPALSTSQMRLINLMSCDDADVDMDELVEAIQSDQALTMRTLRIARSAGYGFQGNLLPSAVTFLGIQKIRQIVQSATVLEVFEHESAGMDLTEFWRHSIAVGMVMQMISRDNRQSVHFMAGLLHDVGKLILDLKFAPYAKAIHEIAVKEKQSSHLIEQELIGISHSEIGQEVAALWQLPNEISESIAFHHMPSDALRHKLLTALVYLADMMVRRMEIGDSGNRAKPEIIDEFAEKVKLPVSMEDVEDRREEIVEQVDAIVSGE